MQRRRPAVKNQFLCSGQSLSFVGGSTYVSGGEGVSFGGAIVSFFPT